MITELYKEMAAALKAVKDCPVYKEDIPQNFRQRLFWLKFMTRTLPGESMAG